MANEAWVYEENDAQKWGTNEVSIPFSPILWIVGQCKNRNFRVINQQEIMARTRQKRKFRTIPRELFNPVHTIGPLVPVFTSRVWTVAWPIVLLALRKRGIAACLLFWVNASWGQ